VSPIRSELNGKADCGDLVSSVVLHMKKIITLIACLTIGCTTDEAPNIGVPSNADSRSTWPSENGVDENSRAIQQLRDVLTRGQWVKDLGEGAFSEQWVFRFYPDGTYSQQIFSDFTSRPIMGKWKLTPSNETLSELTLSDLESGEHYILAGQTFVRYDHENDLLVATGPRFDREQTLRHEHTE
jgi:hypothetical protein